MSSMGEGVIQAKHALPHDLVHLFWLYIQPNSIVQRCLKEMFCFWKSVFKIHKKWTQEYFFPKVWAKGLPLVAFHKWDIYDMTKLCMQNTRTGKQERRLSYSRSDMISLHLQFASHTGLSSWQYFIINSSAVNSQDSMRLHWNMWLNYCTTTTTDTILLNLFTYCL